MTDRCPNCGYCPACKRHDSVPVLPTVAPNPYLVGWWCACGMWVALGPYHICGNGWRWQTPWGSTWTSGTTGNTNTNTMNLVVGRQQ